MHYTHFYTITNTNNYVYTAEICCVCIQIINKQIDKFKITIPEVLIFSLCCKYIKKY